jgi:hypothetical protein
VRRREEQEREEEEDWIEKEREYKTTNTAVFNDDVLFTS